MRRSILAFVSSMAMASGAWASSNGEVSHGINWWGIGSQYRETPAMGWYIITFVIFLAGLIYLVRKPLNLFLEARSKDIRTAIEEAKIAKIESEKRLREYEDRLQKLDQDIVQMKADFVRQGEIEKAQLQQDAERMAAQISQDTEDMIAAEVRHAMIGLKNDLSREVIVLASDEIKKRITKQVDLNMRSAFARDVGDVRH